MKIFLNHKKEIKEDMVKKASTEPRGYFGQKESEASQRLYTEKKKRT